MKRSSRAQNGFYMILGACLSPDLKGRPSLSRRSTSSVRDDPQTRLKRHMIDFFVWVALAGVFAGMGHRVDPPYLIPYSKELFQTFR